MKFPPVLRVVLANTSTLACAVVGADDAKQLSTTLTEFGVIKVSNAQGTIPAYEGGL